MFLINYCQKKSSGVFTPLAALGLLTGPSKRLKPSKCSTLLRTGKSALRTGRNVQDAPAVIPTAEFSLPKNFASSLLESCSKK